MPNHKQHESHNESDTAQHQHRHNNTDIPVLQNNS